MPECVITKAFVGPDGALMVGQLVSIPDGTRLAQLTDLHYVRIATDAEIASAEEVPVEPPQLSSPSAARKIRRRR